jgi:hypothetical protein
MIAAPSTSREATLTGVATGLAGTLTAKVINPPAGTVVVAETTSGITEGPTGTYTWVFTTPSTRGQYLIVWDYGGAEDPVEELEITATGLAAESSPGAGALCSLEDVRDLLQTNDDNTDQDDVITDLIARASDAILFEFAREFAPAGDPGETRRFQMDLSAGLLDLAPYDARAVTAVVLDPDDDAVELETTDWRLGPLPSRHGVYRYLRLTTSQGGGIVEVDVTGTWGFATVPRQVRQAAALTVVTWMRKDVAAFSSTYNLDESRVERPEAIPSAACALLRPFRLVTVG